MRSVKGFYSFVEYSAEQWTVKRLTPTVLIDTLLGHEKIQYFWKQELVYKIGLIIEVETVISWENAFVFW